VSASPRDRDFALRQGRVSHIATYQQWPVSHSRLAIVKARGLSALRGLELLKQSSHSHRGWRATGGAEHGICR
jgi:hypothetical protein